MAEMPVASVTRYHEYMTTDAAFKGFENYREEQEKAAETITPNTSTGQYNYPDLTAVEKALEGEKTLLRHGPELIEGIHDLSKATDTERLVRVRPN
jgi:hypothetical protein